MGHDRPKSARREATTTCRLSIGHNHCDLTPLKKILETPVLERRYTLILRRTFSHLNYAFVLT